jgi:predicted lipid-binding transport protein (Tim44 family)
MKKNTLFKIGLVLAAFVVFFAFVLQIDSYARVGGGGSMGSRGSRSFSVPGRSTPSSPMAPSQPYRPYQSGGGSFFRSMLGGMAGGFLGGMLFRSLGFGGWGMGGGGIGFFEVILVVLILYGVYRFLKRRRETGGAYYQSTAYGQAADDQSQQPVYGPAGQESDVEMGLRYIRQMDPYFDEPRFRDMCLDTFFRIQGAWANREMAPVRDLLTAEMYRAIGNDADKLKAEHKINKLDNIAVRSTDIVEAWQESGRDYITVRFYANLLDYTVEEKTGEVVAGSKADPVKFEEYWTYTRLVGSNPWQLSAITQPQ